MRTPHPAQTGRRPTWLTPMLAALVLAGASAGALAAADDPACTRHSPGEAPPFHACADEAPPISTLNAGQLPAAKQTSAGFYVTAEEAHTYLAEQGARALFVDIRTRPEASFLGMPTAADALVPFMEVTAFLSWEEKRSELQLEANPAFVPMIQERLAAKGLDRDAPVFLICRSGTRSAKAANLLAAAGFTRVYSVVDGYEGDVARHGANAGQRVVNGWKNARLPWTYAVPRQKLTMR